MKFYKLLTLLPSSSLSLRIEVNGDVALPDPKNNPQAAAEPIMQSFANHLHSVAGLFSSIIGKGNPSSGGRHFYNPACYLPETEDSEFPNWSGPYCLISYDDSKTCAEEFNCNFFQSYEAKLPNSAKLCCRNPNDPWSEKFQDSKDILRVFTTDSNTENLPSNSKSISGHYSLFEIIFNSRVKPEAELYLNKFDMGSACKMWGESLGYYSLNPVPESGNYEVENNDSGELAVCAMERKFQVAHGGKEVPSIMPFCSFKITDQECPDYAPLFLTFPKNVVSLPNDNLFSASSFIDPAGLCCSITQHKTIDQTVVNLDYLPANWTMNDFQVIKWPYAKCPIFEFPKMDLIEHDIEYSSNSEYPWAFSDLKFSMCQYKKPEVEQEVTEPAPQEDITEPAPEIPEAAALPQFTSDSDGLIEVTKIDFNEIEENASGEPTEPAPEEVVQNDEEYENSLVPKLEV